MEHIIEKIQKLLNVTEKNGASEAEALSAALHAQKLMAKHHIEITDLNTKEAHEMKTISHDDGKGYKWRYMLANIVAKNFCCKVYVLGRDSIVFFGYENDIKIAHEVFSFLFKTGNKFAVRYYNECKKAGRSTSGVMNTYLNGFCAGIKEALDAQCAALMVITPKEVEDKFTEMMKGSRTMQSHLKIAYDARAYESGKTAGRDAAGQKKLNGGI